MAVTAAAVTSRIAPGAAAQASPPDTADLVGTSTQRAARAAVNRSKLLAAPAPPLSAMVIPHPGSDFMVDVIKSLNIDYLAANPGSSFRSLQESLINYGGNSKPEFITCNHEEISVAFAHGYYKAAGKPIAILAHSTVGLQHAAMAVYNAWSDRVPVIMMAGNLVDAAYRRPGVEWFHSAQDPAAMLRDFTKWDDQPASLQHFAESLVRAYEFSMTPPMGPSLIVADAKLQESPVDPAGLLGIPKVGPIFFPQGDEGSLREAAAMLAAARHPVILADRAARTQQGMQLLVQLAELTAIPVVDLGGRMNFPNRHYANLSGMKRRLIREADVILALEVSDLWGQLNTVGDPYHNYRRLAPTDVKLIHINMAAAYMKSNYQDFERYQAVDLDIIGDVQTSLPPLIESCRRAFHNKQAVVAQRTQALKAMGQKALRQTLTTATYAWNASPISTARLAAETWNVIKDENWCLAANGQTIWPHALWNFTEYQQYLGGPGGYGVGYAISASAGAALANKASDRITVSFQPDGDLMYSPGALWTAAHHRLPLMTIMFNNRAYHQEMMHLQNMASLHGRSPDRAYIGTAITDPDIDFAKLASGLGVWSSGPVSDPAQLGQTLRAALNIVKGGHPALVDVICQPR
ncbi:MAG TPA: thiamine pyrophosphate-binding protein [Candidatus Binataceae bacterium]|nr:thiamine pyrophosphate-binding protein [Candidatus Binataceae bacterium]